MTRRPLACLAAGLMAALLAAPVTSACASASASATPGEAPLEVTIDTLSPSVIPRHGRVTLAGQVTNRSRDTWTDLQVYLFTGNEPITSRADLDQAADTGPTEEVGNRIARAGLFAEIGDLEPGESTSYRLSVRRQDLDVPDDPGVYWVGAHVLGALDGVRDLVADGRARTFMPQVARRARDAELALVLPLRGRVRRNMDGRLLGLEGWQHNFSTDGRLSRLNAFAADSPGPVTWVVDPAVLDAAVSVAADNPPLFTGDDGSAGEPDESEGSSPSPSASPDGEETAQPEPTPAAQDAAAWLDSFRDTTFGSPMLALPYGDVDVAAVTRDRLGRIFRRGAALSEATTEDLELDAEPGLAPPSGLLTERGLDAAPGGSTVLLSDGAYPDASGPVVTRPGGANVVLTDTDASSGGPGPNPRRDPLAIRQRVLAEAALQAMSPDRRDALVVTLPPRWDPGPGWTSADFFEGLELPWLTQVDLPSVLAGGSEPPADPAPAYPKSQRDREVPFANQLATQELVNTGQVFADLLTRNDTVDDALSKAAMLASSYASRNHPTAAVARARDTRLRVRRTMQRVTVEGPPFVMMSGETGPIAVTVENNLEEPVTVRLAAQAKTGELKIRRSDPITLGPGQRTPVRMRAESRTIGVHPVTLTTETVSGDPLGTQTQFNVRTSNVGNVIWVIMGVGGAILAVAVAVRVRRRIRAHRRGEDP